jgi:DNA replication protein DnaC
MGTLDELVPVLKKLRLSGVMKTLDLRKRESLEEDLGIEEFLYRLLRDEVERRDAKQTEVRLRRANFEGSKRFEDFDFTFNPKIPKQRIIDLAACHFVDKKENVLLIGPTGVGKSHLAQAIGERACRSGASVLFTSAQRLFAQLRGSRADQSYEKKLLRYTTPDVLIVDDLGLRPLEREEPLDL